jgi:thiamine monophosphate synthase
MLALLATVVASSDLLVLSAGVAPSGLEQLHSCCSALAPLSHREHPRLRLMLREPELDRQQIKWLVQELGPLFAPGGLLLHERCMGARELATAYGLGLHLRSTSDWEAERSCFRGPLGVSAHHKADVLRARACGMQWAFVSPVCQPASKPRDARPHLGEQYVLRLQHDHPEIDIYALGGISPEVAARLVARGGRGVVVLGGVFRGGASTSPQQARDAVVSYLSSMASCSEEV